MNQDSFYWLVHPIEGRDFMDSDPFWTLEYSSSIDGKTDSIIRVHENHNNGFRIYFYTMKTKSFHKAYDAIYPPPYISFVSLDEAKARVNQFITRLCKLKAFI
jgi:hypothetical protein